MTVEIFAALAVWWTVFMWMAVTLTHNAESVKEVLMYGVLALFWPITAPFVLCGLLYRLFVNSAGQMRQDLRNRKLLREFDRWYRETHGAEADSKKEGGE
jgi:hypothetical protein